MFKNLILNYNIVKFVGMGMEMGTKMGREKTFPGDDSIISGATTTNPGLLTMKEKKYF